ncbi:hypothetical protein RJ640_029887, partial [Escallonia rubra]
MKIEGLSVPVLGFLFLLGVFQESVHGRPLASLTRPRPANAAAFARWLVSQSSWGVLNTIASDLGGAPFGNVVSFSDGLPDKGTGIPYFYLTALDPTARNALKDQRSSFTISEFPVGTCGKKDPENPTCAKITLTGKALDGKSDEAKYARTALFSKHSEMKEWPKNHNFQFFKLEIDNIFMINWFGGPKPLTMLLPLCNCQSSLPPQTLNFNPSPPFPSFFFFFPPPFTKSLLSQNPKPPRKPLLLRASSADTKTLPQSAIQRIAEKLRSLGYIEDNNDKQPPQTLNSGSPGEIFVPLPNQLPKHRVGHTFDPSWSTPENPVPEPGSGTAIRRYNELRREVWKEKKAERARRGAGEEEAVPTLAELKLPPGELRRLRKVGIGLDKRLKIGKAGITEGIVNGIHERWRKAELVKIRCEDMSRLNMKRTHDLLERKTGGLVIWRSGSIIVLYRGADYKYPYFFDDNSTTTSSSDELHLNFGAHSEKESYLPDTDETKSAGHVMSDRITQTSLIKGVGSQNRVRFQLPGEAQLAEEADHLLEGLGPRFTDWYGYDPLPVDADLLPAIIPGYRKPFRLLPYGVKPGLTNDEMTTLRRLGRPLPCHFALGRNHKLQGLAAAIIKLWEKCEIAKIAVKKGVQNTNSELMAKELKWLTGGTTLSRDREFIVFYRGKDFLPASVSSAIEQRRKYGIHGLEIRKDNTLSSRQAHEHEPGTSECDSEAEHGMNDQKPKVVSEIRKLRSSEAAISRTSSKLSLALAKKARAEKLLSELEMEEIRQQPEIDKEGITEEERYMLRKVGLRMKPFLLLGRRGVFDGTVENMHLHWKYRELVKIICGERSIEEVHARARTLEVESGGILVSVDRTSKGYAIIVYRGKNYKRPASLRPRTLLNKREALKRSIEAQRRESLKLHVLKLSRNVDDLKLKMARDRHGGNFTSSNTSGVNYALRGSPETTEPDLLRDGSPRCEDKEGDELNMEGEELDITESEPFSEPGKESSVVMEGETGDFVTSNAKPHNVNIYKSSVLSPKGELKVSAVENGSDGLSFKAARLSNRERLLLRKQALQMKKRPVLAIGRSNIVSGVAKAIKAHFQKHPLAIVNVKGRAKGTSVQEVVSKLEEATGAVLISQEPSKVILYRGWGAREEPGQAHGNNASDLREVTTGRQGRPR